MNINKNTIFFILLFKKTITGGTLVNMAKLLVIDPPV